MIEWQIYKGQSALKALSRALRVAYSSGQTKYREMRKNVDTEARPDTRGFFSHVATPGLGSLILGLEIRDDDQRLLFPREDEAQPATPDVRLH